MSHHALPLLRTFKWLYSPYHGHKVLQGLTSLVWLTSSPTPPSHSLCSTPPASLLFLKATRHGSTPGPLHWLSPLPGTLFLLLTPSLPSSVFTSVHSGISLTAIPPTQPISFPSYRDWPSLTTTWFTMSLTSLFCFTVCLLPYPPARLRSMKGRNVSTRHSWIPTA